MDKKISRCRAERLTWLKLKTMEYHSVINFRYLEVMVEQNKGFDLDMAPTMRINRVWDKWRQADKVHS